MAQHTQGKWVIEKYSDGYGISREVDGDLESICAMSKIDDEEQVANLIAAAPKLLEALEKAKSALETIYGLNGDPELFPYIETASKAIAAAKGE